MRLALNLHVEGFLCRFWACCFGPTRPDTHTKFRRRNPPGTFGPPGTQQGEGGGNVRGAAVGRPPTGRPASPGAATGWAIPPDPQQARGGEIPVR